MKSLKLAIAAAVAAAFSVPALANSPDNNAAINELTTLTDTVSVSGTAIVSGRIDVAGKSGASTDNDQISAGNLVITVGGGNDASVTNSANGLTGNAGVNIAAGTGNAQGNEAALSSLQDASAVFASAQTFSTQVSAINANVAVLTNNTANLEGSLTGASGNVGLNLASGSGNMQDNQLAAAVRSGATGGGTLAEATGSNNQTVALTLNGTLDLPVTNSARILDSIAGTGNIGVNVAAGYGNLQHNSLSIAAAK